MHIRIKEYWFYDNITTFKLSFKALLKILKNPEKIPQKLNSLKKSLKLWKNPISKEKSLKVRALLNKPVRIRKFTDHGPNTGFYGPHVGQSECRILQSHIIILFIYHVKWFILYILLNGLTYNPAEYFTSFERIFPSPERARKNARNE